MLMSQSLSLSFCLVAVFFVCVDAADVSRSVVTFNKVARCPESASELTVLHKLQGVLDLRTCLVECSVNDSCALVHFRRAEFACFSATRQQVSECCNQTVSNDGNECESHVRLQDTSSQQDASGVSSSTNYSIPVSSSLSSKLLVFFDFRRSLDNLASPGRFNVTLRGDVIRNETGAHFPGNANSFIDVDTESGSLVSNHLTSSHNFSFFARVERRTYHDTWVHAFHDCSGTRTAGFGDQSGKVWVRHMFPELSTYDDQLEDVASSTQYLSSSDILNHASYGAAFNGKLVSHMYFNRTIDTSFNRQGETTQTNLNCLRLGYFGSSGHYFNGRVICYAIATDALTLSEMQQLDDACN